MEIPSTSLVRLAGLTYRRSRALLTAGLCVLAAAALIAPGVFDAAAPFDIADETSESERAREIFGEGRGIRPESEAFILINGQPSDGEPQDVRKRLKALEGVGTATIGPNGASDALVIAHLDADVEFPSLVGARIADEFADDKTLRPGGTAVAAHVIESRSEHDLRAIEMLAAPVLLLLSFAVFRKPAAAVLPLFLGGFAIVVTLAALRLLAELTQIDLFSLTMATALGTGLAIDYSLFIVARFREELGKGSSTHDALVATLETAGHTVAFSCLTVAFSLAVLIAFPQPFLRSTGIAGALVALLSGVAALTLLPAALALLGPRVGRSVHTDRQARSPWTRIAKRAVRRPVALLAFSLAALVVIAAPGLDLKLTIPDAHVLPRSEPVLAAATHVEDRFPSLPRTAVTTLIGPNSRTTPGQVEVAAGPDGRLASIGSAGGGYTAVTIESDVGPLSTIATEMVERIRAAGDSRQLVTGRSADLIDQRSAVGDRLPVAAGLLVLATIALVAMMTRSIVLPLVALAMNLLTIAATIGLLVGIFQDGSLEHLLDFSSPGAIDISVPIISMAVVFGLSTDYGMFLLSRVREARRHAPSEADAIAAGMAQTGWVVTAAAVLFSVAAGAFVFSDLVIVKEVAVAMAAAVILDATIVRIFLLPAVLGVLGSRAWIGAPSGPTSVG